MFDRLANAIIKHPKPIVAFWILLLIVALPFAANYNSVLSYDMSTMSGADSESVTGSEIMSENFYAGTGQGTIIVIPYDSSEELAEAQKLLNPSGGLQSHLDEKYGAGNVVASNMGTYSKDQTAIDRSGVMLISISYADEDLSGTDEIGNIRDAVSDTKSSLAVSIDTYVTGNDAITYDTMKSAMADISKIDPLSILLIFVLIGLFFLSIVTAVVPPATVGMAYGIVLSIVFFLGGFLDIYYITTIIVLVSMLGAGCDYAIFIISRYREERKAGKDKDAAIKEAVKWAGESVATSGCAVIIGFGVMSFCSFSMVSTMGMILAAGIIVAMLAALTFIPAMISIVGDKIFWPSKIETYKEGSRKRQGFYGKCVNFSKRYFHKAGQRSIKYAVPIVAAALIISVPLCYVAFTSEDSYDMISIMPESEGKEGIDILTERADGGMLMPTYVLYELNSPIAVIENNTLTWTSEGYAYIQMLSGMSSEMSAADENISYALGPTPWAVVYQTVYAGMTAQGIPAEMISPEMVNKVAVENLPALVQPAVSQIFDTIGWNADVSVSSPYIDYAVNYGSGLVSSNGNYAVIMVMVSDEPMSAVSMDSISLLKEMSAGYAEEYSAQIKDTWVTGTAVTIKDISEVVDSEFSVIEIGVVVLIFVLLFFVLGSYFTPVRSLLTILLSVFWTIGLTHIVFTELLGIPVTWIVPIVLLVVCLGLGMDYDILLTTRIKEGKSKGMSNDEAITNALEKSGGIISLCGLIMGGTFLTLLFSSSPMLQEFGFALGVAILIDSLIVVTYLVPALMHLMGDWSWKGPKFLKKRSTE